METDRAVANSGALTSEYWLARRDQLFWASCISLIVTAMSFAIRGDIMGSLEGQFHLTHEQSGMIASAAFWGFTLSIIIGGPLCDALGMGRILWLAFIGHAVGIATTIFAPNFGILFAGTLAIGLGNGLVEAACNPLIATLYPDQKIKRLSQFHMWFPGGIVIGGLLSYVVTQQLKLGGEHAWQIDMALMVVPLLIYGFMLIGKKFPATERAASGVSTGQMFGAALKPFFILFVICMLMTASTELGPGQWIPNILTVTTGFSGILILVLVNGLMAIGRGNAGQIVHRVSPIAILMGSAFFSAIGLYVLSLATGAAVAIVGAVVFAVGVCFFWPTMLGVVSERFPKTGSLGLAIMGGAGNLAVALILPVMGHWYDNSTAAAAGGQAALDALKGSKAAADALSLAKAQAAGGSATLRQVVIFPVIVFVVFTLIYLYDRSRGGYKKEILLQTQEGEAVVEKGDAYVQQA